MVDEFYWFEAVKINVFRNNYEIIKNLDLKIKKSENVILLGPNGSGKSTIIDLINRNLYPLVKKDSLLKIFNEELINIWEIRKKISTVNIEIKNRIHPRLKVIDLLVSGLYGKYCFISDKSDKDVALAENILEDLNLTNISQKSFSYLSEGQKQVVLIGRAIINNPKILILDEPTSNLDYKSKYYVSDQIDELSKLDTKILCVTHDISMITDIYDKILMLKNGSIIAEGSQKEVLNSTNINNLFDINVEIFQEKGKWNIYRKL